MKSLLTGLITFYQRFLSPLKPRCCRFQPSCSQYSKEAITRYGALKGGWKSFTRILKCHPFHVGGEDPVEKVRNP